MIKKPLAAVGITREVLIAEMRATKDPQMIAYANALAGSKNWDPDKLFKMLAKALGKDPKEVLK